jgi:hypothetical protein
MGATKMIIKQGDIELVQSKEVRIDIHLMVERMIVKKATCYSCLYSITQIN